MVVIWQRSCWDVPRGSVEIGGSFTAIITRVSGLGIWPLRPTTGTRVFDDNPRKQKINLDYRNLLWGFRKHCGLYCRENTVDCTAEKTLWAVLQRTLDFRLYCRRYPRQPGMRFQGYFQTQPPPEDPEDAFHTCGCYDNILMQMNWLLSDILGMCWQER